METHSRYPFFVTTPNIIKERRYFMENVFQAVYGLLFETPLGIFMIFTIILGIIKRFTS